MWAAWTVPHSAVPEFQRASGPGASVRQPRRPPHQGFADVLERPALEPFGMLASPVPSALVEVAATSPPQGALRGILWDCCPQIQVLEGQRVRFTSDPPHPSHSAPRGGCGSRPDSRPFLPTPSGLGSFSPLDAQCWPWRTVIWRTGVGEAVFVPLQHPHFPTEAPSQSCCLAPCCKM